MPLPNTDTTTEKHAILGRGLDSFLGNVQMLGAVNTDLSEELAKPGDTINFNEPIVVGTKSITPSNTQPAPTALTTKARTLTLDQWRGSNPFGITHKEKQELFQNGGRFIQSQVAQAAAELAEETNLYLLGLYKKVYNVVGTPATTPFQSSVAGATDSIQKLIEFKTKMTRGQLFGVLDPAAANYFKQLSQFSDADKVGDQGLKITGIMGERYGVRWLEDQQVIFHTAGVPGGTPLTNGSASIGATSIPMDGMTINTGTYVAGDIISFAGHSQTYAVQASVTANGSGQATLSIQPPLKAVVADNAAITLKASHRVNLVFNRRAFYYAQRSLGNPDPSRFALITDDKSGISLRLEQMNQYKQEAYEFDLLYGAACIFPEYAVRLMG